MKVVIALDSFKGCLDSRSAGTAARAGVRAAVPHVEVDVVEVGDGGEGTLGALLAAQPGTVTSVHVVDLLGRPVDAPVGVLEHNGRRTAVLESAQTIGIHLVDVDASLPLRASSYGLGLQLGQVMDQDVDEVVVALGGTGVIDGGAGLLLALGARLWDAAGKSIMAGENPLWRYATADLRGLRRPTRPLTVLTDVTNPLCGPAGAAVVFGPQKGALPDQVRHLDEQMRRWGGVLSALAGRDLCDEPGAGAAGGLGAALLALGAHLQPGFARVAHEVGLVGRLAGADLVLTGEGKVDTQTDSGKVVAGTARLGREAGAVVVVLAGAVARPLSTTGSLVDGAFSIHSRPRSLTEAMEPEVAAAEIEHTAFEVTRLFAAACRHRSHDRTQAHLPLARTEEDRRAPRA